MANIGSSNIEVFPTTTRQDYRRNRLLDERNISGIVTQIVDQKCYVITDNNINGYINVSDAFSFALNGYRFDVDAFNTISALVNQPRYLIASIQINVNSGYYALKNSTDENSKYQGLTIDPSSVLIGDNKDKYYSVTESDNVITCKLVIAERKDNNWTIPDESRVRQIISVCDGGEI